MSKNKNARQQRFKRLIQTQIISKKQTKKNPVKLKNIQWTKYTRSCAPKKHQKRGGQTAANPERETGANQTWKTATTDDIISTINN
jgi:hypothetical protein